MWSSLALTIVTSDSTSSLWSLHHGSNWYLSATRPTLRPPVSAWPYSLRPSRGTLKLKLYLLRSLQTWFVRFLSASSLYGVVLVYRCQSIWEVAWPGIPTRHVTYSFASRDVRRVPRRRRIRIQNGYTDGVNLICLSKSRQALWNIKIESARFSEYVYICDGHNLTDEHEAPWALRAAAESESDSYDENICPTKTTHRTHTSGLREPKELSLSGGPLSGFVCTCYRPSENAWYSVSPIYRGRVYRGIGYIAVACWTPYFCPPISRILQTWRPRAR